MAFFKKKNKDTDKIEATNTDDAFKDSISQAYDELVNKTVEPQREEAKPVSDNAFNNEVFKAKVREFKEKKTQESIVDVMKMLPGRRFLLPSASNIKEPFEKCGNEMKLKKDAVINPVLLSGPDGKLFLPIFTDEQSMTQKSPSGIILNFNFEQCVSIVYDKKNTVGAVVINPFTENMIIGEELLRMVFKEKPKENK